MANSLLDIEKALPCRNVRKGILASHFAWIIVYRETWLLQLHMPDGRLWNYTWHIEVGDFSATLAHIPDTQLRFDHQRIVQQGHRIHRT